MNKSIYELQTAFHIIILNKNKTMKDFILKVYKTKVDQHLLE